MNTCRSSVTLPPQDIRACMIHNHWNIASNILYLYTLLRGRVFDPHARVHPCTLPSNKSLIHEIRRLSFDFSSQAECLGDSDNLEVIKYFISHEGFNPDTDDCQLVWIPICRKQLHIFHYFVKIGADYRRAFEKAADCADLKTCKYMISKRYNNIRALPQSMKDSGLKGNLANIKFARFWIAHGANIQKAVHYAFRYHELHGVRNLVKLGGDIHAHKDLLQIACDRPNLPIIRYLLRHGCYIGRVKISKCYNVCISSH